MNHDPNGRSARHILEPQIAEIKDGIARLIEPHSLPGSFGATTLALLELGIEQRHLRICSTEKSARALLDGVLRKVLERRTGQ